MTIIAGVDEAGRGPLAGPVVAAAVILDSKHPIEGLDDSKRLTAKKREQLAERIKQKALNFSICTASVIEIDTINILQASLLAMRRAIEALTIIPHQILIDGNQIPKGMTYPCEAIVGGDAVIAEISAASILAKVYRDQLLLEYDIQYPGYGFEQHKGYPTKKHYEALEKLGPSDIHRRSFRLA